MKSLFEEMGGTYTLGADGMYYPDLELPEEEPHYGKYGRMRLRYLKEHHKMLYNTLLLDGELVKHLNEVDDTANQRMELLTLQMQEQQGIPVLLNGAVPDYYLARLQIAWHIGLLKMTVSGVIVCLIYMIIMFIIKKKLNSKTSRNSQP